MAVQNPDQANEVFAVAREQREADAEQRRESMSLADEILSARERETVTLDLGGRDVDFRILLGETRDEIEDIEMEVQELASKADEAESDAEAEEALGMTEDEALEKVEAYRDRFIEILVEHATDDSLTREFWLQAFGRDGAGRIAMRLKRQSEQADMTERELRNFRQQRDQ